jgi:phosphatidylserine synthase 2
LLPRQVNAFFLKYVLWVPPLNPLNTYRLILLFLLALPATKEYYTFIENEESDVFNKLGPFAWLGTAVALAETLVCIKFGRGMFPKPWPRRVVWAWGVSAALFSAFMLVWSLRVRRRRLAKPKAA